MAQEGTFTVAFGLATLFFVPASPNNFKLLTEEERETYCRDLADDWSGDADIDGNYQEVFSWSEVTSAFLDAPHVLMTFVALFLNGTMVRPRSIVLSVAKIIDHLVITRHLVLPTCIYSWHTLHFLHKLTCLTRSTPTIVNALGHSPNYTQLLTVRPCQPQIMALISYIAPTRCRHTPAPSFLALFRPTSAINTGTAVLWLLSAHSSLL